MDISVGSTALGVSFLLIVVLILGIIFFMKRYFAKQAGGELAEKYKGRSGEPALEVRNKYPEVDAFNLTGTFQSVGVAIALGLTILVFGWTQYEKQVIIDQSLLEDLEVEIGRAHV